MPPIKRVKFILVFADTFSGWIEAFPTTNKRAHLMVAHLLWLTLFLLKSSPGLECFPPSPEGLHTQCSLGASYPSNTMILFAIYKHVDLVSLRHSHYMRSCVLM